MSVANSRNISTAVSLESAAFLQKIIAKRQLDFFSMEKKEQLVKKNEEDEREKEMEKITKLRSKFTKLFKNFLDNKDA